MRRLRSILAMAAVVGALVAVAAVVKDAQCSCSGGLPYGAIALWAGIVAGAAIGAYAAMGLALRRG